MPAGISQGRVGAGGGRENGQRGDSAGVAGGIPALHAGSRPHIGTDGSASARRVLPREAAGATPTRPPEHRTGAGPGLGRSRSDPRGDRGSEAAPHPSGSERRRCRRSDIHQNKI